MNASGEQPPLKLAYYADDFTGATDALERLQLGGVRTTLFLQTPYAEQLAARPGLEAVGVAGATRSLGADDLEREVAFPLDALKRLGAPHVHYKVCSTFDSSPSVGSIGRVIEIADKLYRAPFVPVLVGTPALGRWCVFGNLFASMGIGAETPAYRLDRHPSMSRHPVTPADESDLTRHLARQTGLPISLFDVRKLDQSLTDATHALRQLLETERPRIVLFDSLTEAHLAAVSALVAPYARSASPVFWVGSSAVESALTSHWNAKGQIAPHAPQQAFSPDGPTLAFAGSRSPVTAEQVENAQARGARVFHMTVADVLNSKDKPPQLADQVSAVLAAGQSVIVGTTAGEDDEQLPPAALGRCFGRLARQVVSKQRPGLLLIAGGDTSSHTATALPIESLDYAHPWTPGAPVCRITSAVDAFDGLLVAFKGGQVGRPELLAELAAAKKGTA